MLRLVTWHVSKCRMCQQEHRGPATRAKNSSKVAGHIPGFASTTSGRRMVYRGKRRACSGGFVAAVVSDTAFVTASSTHALCAGDEIEVQAQTE
eukprot:292702-Pelagomonas_calceolata.AAC.2